MLIDVLDYDVDEEGRVEAMVSIAHAHLARLGRAVVLHMPTDNFFNLMSAIMRASRGEGSITVLQVHSHGVPGEMFGGRLTAATARSQQASFARLAPYFEPGGQAFLKGCTVGQHPELLMVLARAWQVPVTAGMMDQLAGGATHDVYVGPTVTADPNGMFYLNRDTVPREPHPLAH